VTEHELKDFVSRTLRYPDPAVQLELASRLVAMGKTEAGRALAESAVEKLNQRDVQNTLRRRA